MLKRLELVGFKSFADKTEFDFSDGVTAVVGPNGSGKSNVVDAVRWVLGEQSAKSLRSSEMADVIFNGSSSRRGLGMAEVTMTFDNRRRALATDAEEVQITRRVYRSGEGEYLINKQISRLKDIKELFLGSGAGTNAYSIIEQGRVDAFLQASAKERRNVFEEAAGVSRFKAKKIETMRKLERVDQNVTRLKDIVEEVDKQLRNVRLQAAKAQKHQECSERLKELRVGLGLQEYHDLAQRLAESESLLAQLREQLHQETTQAQAWELELYHLEESLTRLEEVIREHEADLAQARQQISANNSILNYETNLVAELESDAEQEGRRQALLMLKINDLCQSLETTSRELRAVEEQSAESHARVRAIEQAVADVVAQLEKLGQQLETDKAEHLEQMRRAGHLQNDVVTYRAEMDNLSRAHNRLRQKTEQANDSLASLERELEELTAAENALQQRVAAARAHLDAQRNKRRELQQLRDETQQQLADLRAKRSGLQSRVDVLEGLERSHEGLDTGAREIFALIEQPDPGPWRTVLGIVADFLTVKREHAPLIDLALGERAQHFVVRDLGVLRAALADLGQPLSGRASFLPLARARRESAPRANRLTQVAPLGRRSMPVTRQGDPGVAALAEQVVQCDHPQLSGLPRQLLSRTLIVRDLDTAQQMASHLSGYRYVTLQGELLEADGTITVGTNHTEAGLLSRKSELRELREQVAGLDQRIDDVKLDVDALEEQTAEIESAIEQARREVEVVSEQAIDLRSRLAQQRERRDGLHEEVVLSKSEIGNLESEIESLDTALQQAQQQASDAETRVQTLQERIATTEKSVRESERLRAEQQEAGTTARVALAQIDERRASLTTKTQQLQDDLAQRQQEQARHRERIEDLLGRRQESQLALLAASAAHAAACSSQERTQQQLADERQRQNEQRHRRGVLTEQSHSRRAVWQESQELVHQQELDVRDLHHRAESLVERLREDYEINLMQIYEVMCAIEEAEEGQMSLADVLALDAGAVGDEVNELKKKLSKLGSVNLDALEELSAQELRAQGLQVQYDDLTSAKRTLEEIIQKICNDSEKLFTETFAEIRGHFQDLFRKLFGGGQADVILEDDNDVLECGIEIIARPPGKELRSISQMSGGERALTAVALLLAIFRSKPSPFCILDEVDAPLDEANVGRLSAVLREFLDLSQFIIVTHHKRTMAAADVLYGVTMQEPGVSKRIAVRFQDWPDDNSQAPDQAA